MKRQYSIISKLIRLNYNFTYSRKYLKIRIPLHNLWFASTQISTRNSFKQYFSIFCSEEHLPSINFRLNWSCLLRIMNVWPTFSSPSFQEFIKTSLIVTLNEYSARAQKLRSLYWLPFSHMDRNVENQSELKAIKWYSRLSEALWDMFAGFFSQANTGR